jgi:hypothetical protein
VSLNAPIRDDGDSGEWQDWLVDEVSDQETRLVPISTGKKDPLQSGFLRVFCSRGSFHRRSGRNAVHIHFSGRTVVALVNR